MRNRPIVLNRIPQRSPLFLGRRGNIVLDAQGEAKISASHLISGQDINVMGESMTIVGMTDHHSSHSQTHETGFLMGIDMTL